MAKMVIDCADPNDLEAVDRAIERAVGRCNITYFRQHKELKAAGMSKNKSESARIIASDSGESVGAARKRIERGEKHFGQVVQNGKHVEITKEKMKSNKIKRAKDGTWRVGRREGAGRPEKAQKAVWKNVQMKMERLIAYMENNCETPAEIPQNTRRAIGRHIDTFF